MTEQEAKEKWCPMARSTAGYVRGELIQAAVNTYEESYTNPNCMVSDCMMWRWDYEVDKWGDPVSNPVLGYCGLAGKPC